jgi:hypothetical protein
LGNNKVIVVDGSNVAYEERSRQGQPKISNLVAVRKALQSKGYEPIIIVDAALRHQVDDPDQLEALFDSKTIQQAPADTDADYFVLAVADEHDAQVVSNDLFKPYHDRFPWIQDRRIPLMIVEGLVEFYEPRLEEG